ncbi:MAG: hypothetical protein P8130_03905 [Deltaproteobacteria bacterium]
MDTSILKQELEPLKAQIDETQVKLKELEEALSGVEAELDTFSLDQQRFDALQDVCNALDKLGQLEAAELFWEGLPEVENIPGHLEGLRQRIAQFNEEIRGTREKRDSVKDQIELQLDELYDLKHEVALAHEREERRQEEFVIEREVSELPFRPTIMPWSSDGESQKAFRRALAMALLFCFLFGLIIPIIKVPIPSREVVVEIPKRLATLVKKEKPKPVPVKKIKKQEKTEKEEELAKTKKESKEQKPVEKEEPKVAATPTQGSAKAAARKKAESTGVLAFKSSFSDLMDKTPVASLGIEAHLTKNNPRAPGQATAYRSMVALEGGGGGSGGISGIGTAGVSRKAGFGGTGGGGGAGVGIGGVGVEPCAARF